MELYDLIWELEKLLNESGVADDVRDMIVKFVISLVVFWLVLLGLGCWIMWLKRK